MYLSVLFKPNFSPQLFKTIIKTKDCRKCIKISLQCKNVYEKTASDVETLLEQRCLILVYC